MKDIVCLPTLEALRRHIHETLCRRENLDPSQAPMQQALIMRQGRSCGLFFQVEGPRLLRNYALWVGEENRILFYNSTGERIAETRLTDAPDPRSLAA